LDTNISEDLDASIFGTEVHDEWKVDIDIRPGMRRG
jgi:hypothetical protein